MKKYAAVLSAIIALVVLSACKPSQVDVSGWTTYTTANSKLVGNSVNALAISEEGRVWVGTGDGLSMFSPASLFLSPPDDPDALWTTYTQRNYGLSSDFVNALAIDSEGTVLIGADNVICNNGTAMGGYSQNPGGHMSVLVFAPPLGECGPDLPNYLVTTIVIDDKFEEAAWIGTSEYGIKISYASLISSKPMAYTTENSGLASNAITAIAFDQEGRTWVGTPRGISVLDDQDWTTHTAANSGLVSDNVTALVFDPQGRAWIGTANGLSVFDDGKWTTYTSLNSDLVSNAITTVAADSLGRIWVGTEDGISMFDQKVWTTYTSDNSGLVSNRITAIAFDPEGHVWIGTDQGLNVFEIEAPAAQGTPAGSVSQTAAPTLSPNNTPTSIPAATPIPDTIENTESMRIIFYGYPTRGNSQTGMGIISNAELSGITELSFLSYGGELSPNGDLVAYDNCEARTRGIYIGETDGSNLQKVTSITAKICVTLRWSPDGTKLSYHDGEGGLHIIDTATGEDTTIPVPHLSGWHSWAPSGNMIVYGGRSDADLESGDYFRLLFITDLEGNIRQLTNARDFDKCAGDPPRADTWSPAWSPDGGLIAFVSCEELFTIAPNGSNLTKIVDSVPVYSPRWSSIDGDSILFLSISRLMKVRRDGSGLTQIGVLPYRGGPFSIGPYETEPSNMPSALLKDCLPYNVDNLRIVDEGDDGWLLTDGVSRMLILDDETDAKNALALAKRHTAQCFIGRDNTRSNRQDYIVEYWAGDSGLTTEIVPEDCLPYNPNDLQIVDEGASGWLLTDGESRMLIMDNQQDAEYVLTLANRYTKQCFIGRDNTRPDREDYIVAYWE